MIQQYHTKHCLIGAGFTGLAVAAALGRSGISYDQLEADTRIGGNWYHGVYETAHIISSRTTTEYSDFPMPAHYPDFPSAGQMLEYLESFAEHFDLMGSIQFSTRVEQIEPLDDGEWEVRLEGGEVRRYGGVIVCNGHHWDMRFPQYPGKFTGEVIHSKQYKSPEILSGKRVLVVGGGNSGCDIAVEAARFADESHISLRRGYWFMPKTVMGRPMIEYLRPWMSSSVQRFTVERMLRLVVGPYRRYGLQEPTHPVFDRHPTINSQLLYFLKHGTISPHVDIERLDGDDVLFTDGSRITVDLIIYATGYKVSIPFVAPEVIRWKDGYPDLLGGVFAARHRNFYVVGIGQPRYGAGPLLTLGAELLATAIEVQPRLEQPLGVLLKRLGLKPLDNYLMDPHATMRQMKIGIRLLPRLPLMERLMQRLARAQSHFAGRRAAVSRRERRAASRGAGLASPTRISRERSRRQLSPDRS